MSTCQHTLGSRPTSRQRASGRWTLGAPMWLAGTMVAATLIFGAVTSYSAEETPVVPAPNVQFRSVDEAIGWVKAKGKCGEPPGFCQLVVSLVARSSKGKPLSPGRVLDAQLFVSELVDLPRQLRKYTVTIRRRHTLPLSARDPDATLTTLTIRSFEFNSVGSLVERTNRLLVRTARDADVFDVWFPLPEYGVDADSVEDWDILTTQLGVHWDWTKK
jgi:hypothetical protein